MDISKILSVSLVVLSVMAVGALVLDKEDSKYHSLNVYEKIVTDVYRDGKLVGRSEDHNLITNAGFELVETDLTGAGNTGVVGFIAMGNGTTPVVGDTSLNAELSTCGFSRAAGTKVDRGNGNWSFSAVFTSSCTLTTLNTTGLYNETSSGTLLAAAALSTPVSNLLPNDQVNQTWYVCAAAAACLS